MPINFKKIIFLLFAITLFTYTSYSSNLEKNNLPTSMDELNALVKKTTNEKEKLAALENISVYMSLNQPDKKALEYIEATNSLAKKLKNKKAQIRASLLFAKVFIEENKIHEAYNHIDNALNESKNYSYNTLIGKSLLMMAYFYKRLGFFGYSLEYCLKADQYISSKEVNAKFYLYIDLGDVYSNLNEYNQAINTYYKAFDLAQTNNRQILIANAIAKISSVYIALGQNDKAITYLNKALNIATSHESTTFIKILILNELAKAYSEGKKYEDALKLYHDALEYSNQHGFIFYISEAYLNIAKINIKLKRYHKAIYYLNKCSEICSKSPVLYDIQLQLYNAYCQYYKSINNYQKALEYNEKSAAIRDKLFIDKVANRIAILETKFRHEQSQKSNELLKQSIALKEEKIKSDQRFILFLIIISLLILLLTALFIVLYCNRRKFIEKLNHMNHDLEATVLKRTGSLKRTVDNLKKEIRERRKLQKLVEKISDREQRRIGHDIHDSLGQILVGISFTSQALARKLKKREILDLAEDASVIVDTASMASTQARDLAKLLSPVELKEEGLDNALQRLSTFIKTNYKINCNINIQKRNNLNLNIQTATNIYRIIQEATNNAVKHSQAEKIEVLLDLTKRTAILSVNDNGKGLSLKDRDNFTGMGLKIMETRSELLNGRLSYTSEIGKGTTIKCTFPLNYKPLI